MQDSTPKQVLVGIVGHYPTSILVCARILDIQRVVLLCTPQTEGVGLVLKDQVGVPCQLVVWHDHNGLQAVVDTILTDVDPQPDEQVILDITGGLKTLAIGAWQGLVAALHHRLMGVYLGPGGALYDARMGDLLEPTAPLNPEDYLAWHGAEVSGAAWEGALDAIPEGYRQRALVGDRLRAVLASGGDVSPNQKKNSVAAPARLPLPLPSGLRLDGNRLVSEVRGYFSHHGWLEELAVALAAEGCGPQASEVSAACNLSIMGADAASDEADLVLVRGARVVVVEAKARGAKAGAGADILKRARKAERFFAGSSTQVIFFHPAWGAEAPGPLRDLVGRNVTLVGASTTEYVAAVRRGLGLA